MNTMSKFVILKKKWVEVHIDSKVNNIWRHHLFLSEFKIAYQLKYLPMALGTYLPTYRPTDLRAYHIRTFLPT